MASLLRNTSVVATVSSNIFTIILSLCLNDCTETSSLASLTNTILLNKLSVVATVSATNIATLLANDSVPATVSFIILLIPITCRASSPNWNRSPWNMLYWNVEAFVFKM